MNNIKQTTAFILIFMLNGCSTIEIDLVNLLLENEGDNNQCLLAPLHTNEGFTLPKGTRGTFLEKNKQATFITFEQKQRPTFHDITGQNWHMRSCD